MSPDVGTAQTPQIAPVGTAPVSVPDWPQKGFLASNVGATSARIPDSPAVEWQTTLPGDAAYTAPVVGNGRIYFLLYGASSTVGGRRSLSRSFFGGKR